MYPRVTRAEASGLQIREIKQKSDPAGPSTVCYSMVRPPHRTPTCFRYLNNECRPAALLPVGVSIVCTMLEMETESTTIFVLDENAKTSLDAVMRPDVEVHRHLLPSGTSLKQSSVSGWFRYDRDLRYI